MKERSDLVERALAMLHAAPSRQTVAPSMPASGWRSRWRELVLVTHGLESDDPRVDLVLKGLAECNRCYKTGDLDDFQRAAAQVRRLMAFAPGAQVTWESTVNHRLCILGPAVIEYVHYDDGKLYVFVVWHDLGRWISECIITEIRER